MQSTAYIFMVRPASFMYNKETALSNTFQKQSSDRIENVQHNVINEFDLAVKKLKSFGVQVSVYQDTQEPQKPDAIFPNNWISLHANGKAILYPLCAPNRRLEKRMDIVEQIQSDFWVQEIIDLSQQVMENRFLEGTGSIIFDHDNKNAYACRSPRTNPELFYQVCSLLGYHPILFSSFNKKGKEIYHTNVMMCIGTGFAAICLASITDIAEKKTVIDRLSQTGHEIIDLSVEQIDSFAGNMLQVKGANDQHFLVLSQSACDSLTSEQKNRLHKYVQLIPLHIPTIETLGGGSARCMIAEIFTPKKE